jgi:hypothetical protein
VAEIDRTIEASVRSLSLSLESSSHFPGSKPSASEREKAYSLLLWGERERIDLSVRLPLSSFEVSNFVVTTTVEFCG